MRILLLILLAGGLLVYLYTERQRNYPLKSLTLASGETFQALQLSDDCGDSGCLHRLVYLTSLRDTLELQKEARAFLPWLEARMVGSQPPHSAAIFAMEPGLLRIAPPVRLVVLRFGLEPTGTWRYLGHEDATPRMRGLLSAN